MSAHSGSRSIDVGSIIEHSPIGLVHYGIFTLCALCMVMDGFDLQALGYVAPVIVSEWRIPASAMGPILDRKSVV